eukprot:SM000431S16075  [mRNA]  locus=s431:22328:22588:- [translate_table: standard]
MAVKAAAFAALLVVLLGGELGCQLCAQRQPLKPRLKHVLHLYY